MEFLPQKQQSQRILTSVVAFSYHHFRAAALHTLNSGNSHHLHVGIVGVMSMVVASSCKIKNDLNLTKVS